MEITYRNIVKFQQAKFPEQVREAMGFLDGIYDSPDFSNLDIIFSDNYKRSIYYRNERHSGKYLTPNVCIANHSMLYLYKKKSLKLINYKLNVGNHVSVLCSLIHELTHHIQYNEGRARSELETTKNEVDYLKVFYPVLYKKLKGD